MAERQERIFRKPWMAGMTEQEHVPQAMDRWLAGSAGAHCDCEGIRGGAGARNCVCRRRPPISGRRCRRSHFQRVQGIARSVRAPAEATVYPIFPVPAQPGCCARWQRTGAAFTRHARGTLDKARGPAGNVRPLRGSVRNMFNGCVMACLPRHRDRHVFGSAAAVAGIADAKRASDAAPASAARSMMRWRARTSSRPLASGQRRRVRALPRPAGCRSFGCAWALWADAIAANAYRCNMPCAGGRSAATATRIAATISARARCIGRDPWLNRPRRPSDARPTRRAAPTHTESTAPRGS
jgi:hypothetical protein